jgi:hypothetical protein
VGTLQSKQTNKRDRGKSERVEGRLGLWKSEDGREDRGDHGHRHDAVTEPRRNLEAAGGVACRGGGGRSNCRAEEHQS